MRFGRIIPLNNMLTIRNSARTSVLAAIVMLCGEQVVSVNGQQISRQEFEAILRRGIAHEEVWAGRSFRFKKIELWRSTRPIEIIEVDGSKNIRALQFTPATESLESETIIVGEDIYERPGTGNWRTLTLKTLALERKAQREAMSQALVAADNKKHRDLAMTMLGSTTAAVMNAHRSYYFAVANIPEDAVFDYWGTRNEDGESSRIYTVCGSFKQSKPTDVDLRECTVNITYWFDGTTGILRKARTRFEWLFMKSTRADTTLFEWRLDPDINITAPQSATR